MSMRLLGGPQVGGVWRSVRSFMRNNRNKISPEACHKCVFIISWWEAVLPPAETVWPLAEMVGPPARNLVMQSIVMCLATMTLARGGLWAVLGGLQPPFW